MGTKNDPNRRVRAKQTPILPRDADGREMERVLVVRVKGRRRLEWRVKG